MSDIYDVSEFYERAATIPVNLLRNLSTHGDAVVIAKRFCSEDASGTEIDNLATAIESRAKWWRHK